MYSQSLVKITLMVKFEHHQVHTILQNNSLDIFPNIYNIKDIFGCIELPVLSKNDGMLPFTTGSRL